MTNYFMMYCYYLLKASLLPSVLLLSELYILKIFGCLKNVPTLWTRTMLKLQLSVK